MNIVEHIPFGRENAINRRQLEKLTGFHDRQNRSLIKEYNRQQQAEPGAVVILSSSSARGYWRTSSIEEMERYLAESHHRRNVQAENDEPIEQIVAAARKVERPKQGVIFVRSHTRRKKKDDGAPQIEGQMLL